MNWALAIGLSGIVAAFGPLITNEIRRWRRRRPNPHPDGAPLGMRTQDRSYIDAAADAEFAASYQEWSP